MTFGRATRALCFVGALVLGGCVHGARERSMLVPDATRTATKPMKHAVVDPHLRARIVARRSLHYRNGADESLDRPAHVRAASGLAWVGAQLAAVQDDAHFLALIDPQSGFADAIALPAGDGGKRLFDDTRGTKHLKLDLESCFVREGADVTELVALGSGSKPLRERVVHIRFRAASEPEVQVIDAHSFYRSLRAEQTFSGSELNLEGAVLRDGTLFLFQRGNGSASPGHNPVNAIGALPYATFELALEGVVSGTIAPVFSSIEQVDLGSVAGVPFSFTDATLAPSGSLVFLASAEASPDATSDGLVHGTRIGELTLDGHLRIAPLLDEHGAPSRVKAEGIVFDRRDARRAFAVVDMDDPALASELLELEIDL